MFKLFWTNYFCLDCKTLTPSRCACDRTYLAIRYSHRSLSLGGNKRKREPWVSPSSVYGRLLAYCHSYIIILPSEKSWLCTWAGGTADFDIAIFHGVTNRPDQWRAAFLRWNSTSGSLFYTTFLNKFTPHRKHTLFRLRVIKLTVNCLRNWLEII